MSSSLIHDSQFFPEEAARPLLAEPVCKVDLDEFTRDLFRNIRRLHDVYGPIAAVQDCGQRIVFLFSPELNQQVLSDAETFHARFFAVRGPKRSAQRRLTSGLLAMNGDQHRRNRRIVKEPFGLRAITTYGAPIADLTNEMLATWRLGEVRDMAEEMRQYMLRVTSTLLFGLDDPELACRLGDMIAQWVSLNHEVGVGALVPNERFRNHYEELLAFAEKLEAEIMGVIRRRRESSVEGRDVLSILVRSHDEEGGLSDEELVGQAAVLFSAAHMTTAHSLTWTLLLLAQHPSVMRQLWTEMSGSAGEDGNPQSDLSLLDRVIKESMRVLPASAYSQRINSVPVQLGPLHLQRGTGIVFSPLVTHHLAELYPEPERFLPDRWLTLRPSPYAYHPFGAGPRLCIGGPLASAIMRIALRQILSRFRLTVVPGAEICVHVESTMLVPTHGVPMQIAQADGNFSSSPISGNIHELVNFVEGQEFAAGNGADHHTSNGKPVSVAPRVPR